MRYRKHYTGLEFAVAIVFCGRRQAHVRSERLY